MKGCIVDIEGIKVGTVTENRALTGCTVVVPEEAATAGVDVRGGAPGTRETDLLQPMRLVNQVHGVLLTGGSAFGLDAAAGVMQYMEEKGKGFAVGPAMVPAVPAAVIFDLFNGDASFRPDKQMGYRACENASSSPVSQGSYGAGTGATVGKILGPINAARSGQGTASRKAGQLIVGALVIVNAFGDVFNRKGEQIAGPVCPESGSFLQTSEIIKSGGDMGTGMYNTTLGVVATNARLSKEGATKVAQMAQNGLACSIWPVHTMWDGDTIFTMSLGEQEADWSLTGILAAEAVAEAVENAVLEAGPAGEV